ncbi:MAG: tetratricopeptide repeat protein [Rhodospirillales bacterium]|nr:tetratricopeptide repeat protein [Rhodospirillales bacterium]
MTLPATPDEAILKNLSVRAAGHAGAGCPDQAATLYRRILSLQPLHPDAHHSLGIMLNRMRQVPAAEAAFRAALACRPDNSTGTMQALVELLQKERRLPDAEILLRRLLRLKPDHPFGLYELARTLKAMRRFPEAVRLLRRLLAVYPDMAEAHCELGGLLMWQGDLEGGFAGWEWRKRTPNFPSPPRDFPEPEWDGGALDGRTLLVYAERDFGDSLQYVRYVRLLAERGERVALECQAELSRLFAASLPTVPVLARGMALPPFDCHASLVSLPHLFRTRLETVPAPVPYLLAPRLLPDLAPPPGTRLTVGLVWASRGGSPTTDARSLPPALLAPLLALPGVRFYSLQVGERAADLAGLGEIEDLTPRIRDFADTAAFMAALDLIITVDTAAAHLAGGLGRPTWVLLPYSAAFRWHLKRPDSPWYPTLRLFRQPLNRQWPAVTAAVRQALIERLG